MAKRGRKPSAPYVTMWKEVVEGVRRRVIERDARNEPTVWHLYPIGCSVSYCGTVRKGDILSERRAVAKFLRWKAEREGLPWEEHVGDDAFVDATWLGMLPSSSQGVIDRRVKKLALAYAVKYRDFIRDLIRSDPKKAAAELEIDELAWLDRLAPPSPSMSLTEVGKLYFKRRKRTSTDWKRKMERMWGDFVQCVKAETVRDVTSDDLSLYYDLIYDALNKGKSPTYVAHRFGCVKTILTYASKRGREKQELERVLELCEILEMPEKVGVNPQPISREHFSKLLEAVDSQPKWKAIFLLSLNAALYPSEVAAVKKQHIELDERTLAMDRGKTGVLRVAVLWHRTIEAIRDYQTARPHQSEYLFVCKRAPEPFLTGPVSWRGC